MKIQSVSQLGALSIEDLLKDDNLSAVIEVSKMNDIGIYDSQKFDFKNFIMWIQAQIADQIAIAVNNLSGTIDNLSSTIDNNYVHRTGNEAIDGEKNFIGTLKANSIAELTAQHALWS